MLQLKDIVKTYITGDLRQDALKNVSISFRENEFVSILGQSGSGKTTLLNIIGGLDRYTSGDLMINGVSTKKYKDADWDYYRNNSIGFVFQSYNLIPHQTVLANVELALTLAGISKKERRQRAVEVLQKVGLGDHIHKKPNQMSGGQMQRVAIARALINNPDILLADEPTGALDSETSVQIMELLEEIAKEKLVIMVTHNPELAEQYSTRIVKLLDGKIISDSNPCSETDQEDNLPKKHKKISMSFATALSLSANNLRTKKGRTFLTAFAGSIGIIGIALILSISTGIQTYVNSIQRDTLSSYPIAIQQQKSSLSSMITAANDAEKEDSEQKQPETIYANNRMYEMFNAMFTGSEEENNLTALKTYLEKEMNAATAETNLADLVSVIQYQYGVNMNTYIKDGDGNYKSTDFSSALSAGTAQEQENDMMSMMSSNMSMTQLWTEILPGRDGEMISDMIYEQYDLVKGEWPSSAEETVLILDKNGEITDVAFYAMGLMEDSEVKEIMSAVAKEEKINAKQRNVTYQEVLGTKFKVILNSDYYTKAADGRWNDIRKDDASLQLVIGNGTELSVVGIIQPKPDATATSLTGSFGYTAALTEKLVKKASESEIVKEQLLPENENFDVLTGLPFVITEEIDPDDAYKAEKIKEYFATLNDMQKTEIYTKILGKPSEEFLEQTAQTYLQAYQTREDMIALVAETYHFDAAAAEEYLSGYSDEELQQLLAQQVKELAAKNYAERAEAQVLQIRASASSSGDLFGAEGYAAVAAAFDRMIETTADQEILARYYDDHMPSTVSGSTLPETLEKIGAVNFDKPTAVNIYAKTFEDKEAVDKIIKNYNNSVPEEDKISYTDYVALMMSGVTMMINAVSYGLIGFVSISLIVSSIMIGIITYISVLERTKEIGILRSVGASKKDISRVFNAETAIVGLAAGLIGIGITLLLNLPLCLIAKALTGISQLAVLPLIPAVILIVISVALTMIAGLIPSRLAAKKDPVIALRSE